MGMLKHCPSYKGEKNNNLGFEEDENFGSRNSRSASTIPSSRATLALPDPSGQRHPSLNPRASGRQSIGSRSTRTNITTYSCSCRSERQSRISRVSTSAELHQPLTEEIIPKRPRSLKSCKLCLYTFLTLIAIICTLSGIAHFYISFYPEDFYLNQGDIKLVKYSTYFCGTIHVTGENTPLRLTVMSNPHTTSNMVSYRLFQKLQLHQGVVWERSFYLLANSIIIVKVETSEQFDVLFFDDAKRFEIWKSRKETATYIKKETCCTQNIRKEGIYTLTAKTEGQYFIVFYRSTIHNIPADINIALDVNRTTLDFSSTISTCMSDADKSCDADLRFNSDDRVAVEIPRKQKTEAIPREEKITWQCKGRVWFYFVAFGVSYLIIVLLLFVLYLCFKQGIFHWCLRKSICYKKIQQRKREKYTTGYQNDACDELSRTPSMISLQWESECRDNSFGTYQEVSNISSSRRTSIAAITCSKCSSQRFQLTCTCGHQLEPPQDRIATIYSDIDKPVYSDSDKTSCVTGNESNDVLNTNDSGICVDFYDTGEVPMSVLNANREQSPTLALISSEKKIPSPGRSRSLDIPRESSSLLHEDGRKRKLKLSISETEVVSPREASSPQQHTYRSETPYQLSRMAALNSSDEIFI